MPPARFWVTDCATIIATQLAPERGAAAICIANLRDIIEFFETDPTAVQSMINQGTVKHLITLKSLVKDYDSALAAYQEAGE